MGRGENTSLRRALRFDGARVYGRTRERSIERAETELARDRRRGARGLEEQAALLAPILAEHRQTDSPSARTIQLLDLYQGLGAADVGARLTDLVSRREPALTACLPALGRRIPALTPLDALLTLERLDAWQPEGLQEAWSDAPEALWLLARSWGAGHVLRPELYPG